MTLSGKQAALLSTHGWSPFHLTVAAFLFVAPFSIVSLTLTGCASEGPLKPPSLNLPAPVRGLAAQRMGDAVDLRWTTPGLTSDGVSLTGKHGAGALQAEICRDELSVKACKLVAHVPVATGTPASFHDVLPGDLAEGQVRLLHYRVRILNDRGHGGEYSAVDALAGPALPVVTGLQAVPVAHGVSVRWQPDPGAGGDRTLLRVDRGDLPRPVEPGARAARGLLLALEPTAQDPGGAIDAGAKPGIAQTYSVTRSRTIHAGGQDLTMSSRPASVTVSADAEAAPPKPPGGLEAVANTLGTAEIDLVWQPEEGASAYRVYRAEAGGAADLLTPEPLRTLTYVDKAVRPGVRYRYSVASVSSGGASGARSGEVVESIPLP